MNKKLFFSAVSAILVASAVPAFAADFRNQTTNSQPTYPAFDPEYSLSSWHDISFSAEGFYATALEKMVEGTDYIDIYGVSFRLTKSFSNPLHRARSNVFASSRVHVQPEIFSILSFGYGSKDYYKDYYNYTGNLFSTQFAVGANLRFPVSDEISFFVGARSGLSYENLEIEYRKWSKSESDVGFLYGAGAGIDFALDEYVGIFLGLDYIASTAQPEFYGTKVERQSYVQFSLGVRIFF